MDNWRISSLRDESKHQREMISNLRDQLYELRREIHDNRHKDIMRRYDYVIYGSFASRLYPYICSLISCNIDISIYVIKCMWVSAVFLVSSCSIAI